MKIAFYDTKPYDKIWFDIVAREERIKVIYIKESMNNNSVAFAIGCNAVSIHESSEIDDEVIKTIKNYGINAVLIRSDNSDNDRLIKEKRQGIDFIIIPSASLQSLFKSKWVSYLP